MPLLCGSALNTFPSTAFPSQYKNATAKSSSIFPFQFSLPKLSSSSSSPSSYSIRTHFPSKSFGTTFHVRCRQQDSSIFPQEQEEDPRVRGLTTNNRFKKQREPNIFQRDVENRVEKAGDDSPRTPQNRPLATTNSEETPAWSIDDGRVVQFSGNASSDEAFAGGTTGVTISVEFFGGEYVLKINRRNYISSSIDEEMAQRLKSAGMLFVQAEILREMGEQLLAQYRASVRSIL